MKIKTFVLVFALLTLTTACSSPLIDATTPAISAINASESSQAEPTSESVSSFQAEATSAISVELSWMPVEGATRYRIDLSFGGDFFQIAELDAGHTSFEDFPVPDNSELTYRLQAFSGSEISREERVTLTTPALQPNPLTVQLTEYEPVSPLADFEMPTFDPSDPDFDPSDISIPGFDPETGEIDMEALMGEPVSARADIGPEGGQVSVTAPNQVAYTLSIPTGALEEVTTITLTPIETIEGLPLETFLGAVNIQPEGLILEVPASLHFSFPEGISTPEGMVTMNFGIENGEFYFVPYDEGDTLAALDSSGGRVLASLNYRPFVAGPLSDIALQQLGPLGAGQGTPQQVRQTIKSKAPSKASSQKSNQRAGAQMQDDLAPLIPIEDPLAPLIPVDLLKASNQIDVAANAASNPSKLAVVISDFETSLYRGDIQAMKGLNEKIWDKILEKTQKYFKEQKNECLTRDAFAVQAIGAKLASPAGKFWKSFAERFKAKYGDQLIKEVAGLIKKCKFQYELDSDITLYFSATKTTIAAHVTTAFPLKIKLNPLGVPVLVGTGALKYAGQPSFSAPGCSNTNPNLRDLQKSKLEIWWLEPQFDDNGELSDLKMYAWEITGTMDALTMKCDEGTGTGFTNAPGAKDLWGGLLTFAHFPDMRFSNWSITHLPPGVSSSGELAVRSPDVFPRNSRLIPNVRVVEDTTWMRVIKLSGGN